MPTSSSSTPLRDAMVIKAEDMAGCRESIRATIARLWQRCILKDFAVLSYEISRTTSTTSPRSPSPTTSASVALWEELQQPTWNTTFCQVNADTANGLREKIHGEETLGERGARKGGHLRDLSSRSLQGKLAAHHHWLSTVSRLLSSRCALSSCSQRASPNSRTLRRRRPTKTMCTGWRILQP